MKIATYNVNGVNGRLPVLLRWLKEAQPDIVCLQELKAPQEKFPLADIRKAGYGAIWHGQKAWNGVAILARGTDPVETRRGLPGDPEDLHSRYIEAAVGGLTIGCLYLPNGNPAPGPKFDYKLAWFERLQKYGKTLIALDAPFIMAGDYNVMPTDLDVYRDPGAGGDGKWMIDADLAGAYFIILASAFIFEIAIEILFWAACAAYLDTMELKRATPVICLAIALGGAFGGLFARALAWTFDLPDLLLTMLAFAGLAMLQFACRRTSGSCRTGRPCRPAGGRSASPACHRSVRRIRCSSWSA